MFPGDDGLKSSIEQISVKITFQINGAGIIEEKDQLKFLRWIKKQGGQYKKVDLNTYDISFTLKS